jgi:hypothetical protein
LEEVERELARLKKQYRTLEKDYSRDIPGDFPEPPRSPSSRSAGRERAPAPPGAGPVTAPGVGPVTAPGVGPADVPEWAAAGNDGDRRERFASYFMTGSLGRAAPQLRKERRAMRNKAILMAVVALFFLIVLANFLLK